MKQDVADLIIGAIIVAAVCGAPVYGVIMLLHFILTGQP